MAAINPAANLLAVEKSSGELSTFYDPRRLTGVSVYLEIDREFLVGDRIQFTAPDKALGVANRDLAAVESISPDGRIFVRLDNNRQIDFDATEHRHFDHGYAVTSHGSQGPTAERVRVNADTGVHPDLLNSRFVYVSISRASHEAMLFTDDMAKLSPQTLRRCFQNLRAGNRSDAFRVAGRQYGHELLMRSAIQWRCQRLHCIAY